MPSRDAEKVHVETVEQWRAWLEQNQDRPGGVWVVTWKKATGRPSPGYDALVEEALCDGWIDSTAGTLDAERGMLWFAPRKPRSGWSRVNKQRLERLEAQGRVRPRGRRVLEAAQADGSWTLLDDVEALVVPDDLAAGFAARPGSREQWEAFPRSVKRAHLERLVQAKRAETRARRVEEITAAAAEAGALTPRTGRRARGRAARA